MALIPHVELPRYFTVTSSAVSKTTTKLHVVAELVQGSQYTKEQTFPAAHLHLNDLVTLLPIDQSQFGIVAKMFMASIPLPQVFVLSAKRGGVQNQIVLAFDAFERHWEHTFDTSHLNLTDLGCLLDWAKEAAKTSRHG